MVTKKYYSLNEVSEILGKSKETLRRWDREGKFIAFFSIVLAHPISQDGGCQPIELLCCE